MNYQQYIQDIFEEISSSKTIQVEITPAPKPKLGEYCVNIFPLVKLLKKSPHEIAKIFAEKMQAHDDIFENISTTGGYINFFLTQNTWSDIANNFLTANREPDTKNNENKTIVVDYI